MTNEIGSDNTPPPLPGTGRVQEPPQSKQTAATMAVKKSNTFRRLIWSPPRPSENWAQTLVRVIGNLVRWAIAVPAVFGLGIWGAVSLLQWLEDRPVFVSEYDDIAIGMTPIEVTLLKGKPDSEQEATLIVDFWKQSFTYSGYRSKVWVFFEGQTQETLSVWRVCEAGPSPRNEVIGIAGGDREESVIRHLGAPDKESIDFRGLRKSSIFSKYNLVIGFEKAKVDSICVGTTS